MLFRKMLRDFRKNFGAFFSVFLLSALAMTLFCTFEGHVLSQNVAREAYHKECNLSDVWVYGEGFSEEQLEKVRDLDFVQSVQLRTAITGTAPDWKTTYMTNLKFSFDFKSDEINKKQENPYRGTKTVFPILWVLGRIEERRTTGRKPQRICYRRY